MLLPALDLGDRVRSRFEARHGRPSTGAARAPGRVNLIGEHVDYLGGRCLPIALPYATWVAWAPRPDGRVHLSSSSAPDWRGRRDESGTGWERYVLGALSESRYEGGLDLHVETTVPLGSGLSSSAALICAVLRAVDDRGNADLVAPAIRAEVEHVGAPTGGMDQSVALLAQAGHALLLDFSGGRPAAVPWLPSTVGLELLVVDTGVRHDNGDGAFARIRREAEEAMTPQPNGQLPAQPLLAARRRHVTSELARVEEVVDALVRGDWRAVGAALTASHVSLRDDHHVSVPQLDAVVDAALEAGALGARMTGGGFGGSAIVLAPVEVREHLTSAVLDAFDAHGWVTPTFLCGDASGPATRLG